ncbi:hydroxyacylglutathione hydrolase [Aestuariicella hydrocarbonica]|uniref:Hydroxyacylglutathione hydrolase n=1 Tax=Pseudomaricurvus hydrocarbonicus TaxID=1470433 RepID=A0A9E5MKG7_9GAMM|nr:hydroxyacylglutathione hydrolase [Aestuariicella hydrocarbonica]NHO65362.1 hydroxyacylglutathione hydrolase [Aestuariicella hydrocarbonica]
MLKIIPVPAFNDNYLWLFHRSGSNRAYVVDPGDARPVEQALEHYGLELVGMLITHHHADHTGGIDALQKGRNIPVYGPHSANIDNVTQPLSEGDRLSLKDDISFEVLEVPGHTLDHIAFHCPDEAVLFCGDTLFAGGCGRMFEGEPKQMQASLAKLAHLPPQTRVFCAHEYTQSNLAFAQAVEPLNEALKNRVEETLNKRAQGLATVPSLLQQELASNPFLRVSEVSVIDAAKKHSNREVTEPWEVFAVLRGWKDNF